MSSSKEFQHLKISLKVLQSATNNFSDTHRIGSGGFGKVYKGEILLSGVPTMVAVKRLDTSLGQGTKEFWKEIKMLSQFKHENLVSLAGFCDDSKENILVYEYLSNRSLDLHLNSVHLSWHQRLVICLGAAIGLQYLHEPVEGSQQRVLHRDIKSANILLDHNWRPKIADFGLSRLGPANQQVTFMNSNAVGTMGYLDPLYMNTGLLTKETDVYSFGVVLFEVLCGRPCIVQKYGDIRRFLVALCQKCYKEKKMDTIIPTGLSDSISPKCLERFSSIAYQCLQSDPAERPTMDKVVQELRCALNDQEVMPSKQIQEGTMQKFKFKEIATATNNFKSYIGKNKYGERIYEGKLSIFGTPTRVLIKRFPEYSAEGTLKVVDIHSILHHPNLISTLGYCNGEKETIIVYEYPERGNLAQYIRRSSSSNNTTRLTWWQRLEICAGAAHGLAYLHSIDVLEAGFKTSFVVLDDKWVAKIGDLEIATEGSTGLDRVAIFENYAYNSPEYVSNGVESEKNNVYSFGIVLFEVLCGRLLTEEVGGYTLSAIVIKELYEEKKLDKIVDPVLREEKINSYSVDKYSAIAYQCLLEDPRRRPSMDDVVAELEELLDFEAHVMKNKGKHRK